MPGNGWRPVTFGNKDPPLFSRLNTVPKPMHSCFRSILSCASSKEFFLPKVPAGLWGNMVVCATGVSQFVNEHKDVLSWTVREAIRNPMSQVCPSAKETWKNYLIYLIIPKFTFLWENQVFPPQWTQRNSAQCGDQHRWAGHGYCRTRFR